MSVLIFPCCRVKGFAYLTHGDRHSFKNSFLSSRLLKNREDSLLSKTGNIYLGYDGKDNHHEPQPFGVEEAVPADRAPTDPGSGNNLTLNG